MGTFVPGDNTPWLEVTNVSQQGIWLLVDNEEFFLSYEEYPWFRDARVSQIFNVERPSPKVINWPDLAIDFELDTFRHPEKYPLKAKLGAT